MSGTSPRMSVTLRPWSPALADRLKRPAAVVAIPVLTRTYGRATADPTTRARDAATSHSVLVGRRGLRRPAADPADDGRTTEPADGVDVDLLLTPGAARPTTAEHNMDTSPRRDDDDSGVARVAVDRSIDGEG